MISPLDDRYRELVRELDDIFSEENYVSERVFYEKEWLVFLLERIPELKGNFKNSLDFIVRTIRKTSVDYDLVKQIETKGYKDIKPTNHDVKAIEIALRIRLREKLENQGFEGLEKILSYIHFGITSEDIDNIAIATMLKKGTKVLTENLDDIIKKMDFFAKKYSDVVMLSRTHGQIASPTTLGKEFRNYCERLQEQNDKLKAQDYKVKFSGSTGNFNAFYYALPNIDWLKISKEFVEGFGFKFNLYSTQKEPNDSQAELFQNIMRINNILLDFSINVWNYISIGYLSLIKTSDVGSSVMPHKTNPIDFENAEGNLGIANSLFDFFSNKVVLSRYQRDLSDSTVKRNYGLAYGHSLLAYKKILSGLEKIVVNEKKINNELNQHAEVLAEPIQTKLRTLGYYNAYEILREKTQGRTLKIKKFREIIKGLDIPENLKREFLKLEPKDYFGIADKIAKNEF
ncbi:MAG: adenylosuccinate lyase [Candidatus Woesearchaeota archaeon]